MVTKVGSGEEDWGWVKEVEGVAGEVEKARVG